MDIIIPVILLLLFYLVPELLKRRRRPQEYKYPEIPDTVPPPVPGRAPIFGTPAGRKRNAGRCAPSRRGTLTPCPRDHRPCRRHSARRAPPGEETPT